MKEYNKRLAEVSVILNYLDKKDYEKIPKDVIETIEKNKDTEYIWNYDETKSLKEQNVNSDTIAILLYIDMKYLLNEKQKKFVQKFLEENQKNEENIKKEKYNPDDLFKNKKKTTSKMPIINKERWYKRIFKLIRKLYK